MYLENRRPVAVRGATRITQPRRVAARRASSARKRARLEQVAAGAVLVERELGEDRGRLGVARGVRLPPLLREPRAQLAIARRASRRCGGRRAAARPCRSSGSPRAGTRRRRGRPAGACRGASPARTRSRCRRRAPSRSDAEAEVLAVADRRELGEPQPGASRVGAGLPSPNGASRAELRAEVEREIGCRARRRRRSTSRGSRSASSSTARGVSRERLGERVDVLRPRSRARRRRGGRPSARAGSEHAPSAAWRSKRGDRAAGAFPVAVRARDEDDRAVVALDEPRGDDADHALVPVGAGDARRRGGRAARRATTRPGRSPRAGSAPSTAWRSRFSSSRESASRRASVSSSVRSSSSASRGCPSRPAALRRGARRKPTAPASTVAGSTPARSHQRAQPGLRGARERAQPGDRERAVLVDERDDVGDRREGDEVEMAARDLGVDAEERLAELVDDAGAAELGERVRRTAG